MEKKYSPSEVEQILKIALRSKTNQGHVSQDNIFEIARELNIDEREVQSALREFESRSDIEGVKLEFIKKRKKDFIDHFLSYIIVNSFLLGLNFLTLGRISWAIFPLLGWGLGLALDGINKLRFNEVEFEKYYQKKIRLRTKSNFSELIDIGLDVATGALKNIKKSDGWNNKSEKYNSKWNKSDTK